jgi:hypothetical protein
MRSRSGLWCGWMLALALSGCASSFVELDFGGDTALETRAAFFADGKAMVQIAFPRELALRDRPCAMIEHAHDFVAEGLEYDGARPDDATWWYLRSFVSPGYGVPHRGVHLDTQIELDPHGKPRHSRYAVRVTAVGQDTSGKAHVMQAVADFPLIIGGSEPQELCWRELTPQEVESGGVVLPRGCDCPRGGS